MANETATYNPPPAAQVQASKTVPDGDHQGIIKGVSYETRGSEGFPYLDVIIEDVATGVELKVGYACNRVTPDNDLGLLLARFGAPVEVGEPADYSVLGADTPVAFTTTTEKNKNGRFARIVRATLRPR